MERAVERRAPRTFWEGSFAGFASIIAGAASTSDTTPPASMLAAACGVPLITIFAGFPCRACSTAGVRRPAT